eukprot:3795153-Rhodomonas_salina.1
MHRAIGAAQCQRWAGYLLGPDTRVRSDRRSRLAKSRARGHLITSRGITHVNVTPRGITHVNVTSRGITHVNVTPRGITHVNVTSRGITHVHVTPRGITHVNVASRGITLVNVTWSWKQVSVSIRLSHFLCARVPRV